jgi:hypothetical protein
MVVVTNDNLGAFDTTTQMQEVTLDPEIGLSKSGETESSMPTQICEPPTNAVKKSVSKEQLGPYNIPTLGVWRSKNQWPMLSDFAFASFFVSRSLSFLWGGCRDLASNL